MGEVIVRAAPRSYSSSSTNEGVVQLWGNHTTDMTGNQVWFDLNSAVALSCYLLVPRARAVGMNVVPWGVASRDPSARRAP